MTEADFRQWAEEACSICGDGQSQTWECPQCGREIHESAAALRQAYREGMEAMRDAVKRELVGADMDALAARLLAEGESREKV